RSSGACRARRAARWRWARRAPAWWTQTASCAGRPGELAPSAGDERALDAVCPHLRDADDDVRKAAATALGKLGAQGDRRMALVGPLLDDDDEGVRRSAARAFARLSPLGDAAAIARLTGALRGEDEPEVKSALASALAWVRSGGGSSGQPAAP
ncbi:unnamed protein product, partial [Prorocentrum cordatum]